ncbi:phosphopantetheine-binding protein [Emticicia sp. SJ17W-69]|uniref:phosphopantetheine-binding protein n=1 Tax=Emticicia sp. SJ17W-69 TaxID=3421657 RepID=UPI003EB9C82E
MPKEQLEDWFKENLASELALKPHQISLNSPIEDYRLDSLSSVSLSYSLEEFLGYEIEPTIFNEFETVNELIEWLLKKNN